MKPKMTIKLGVIMDPISQLNFQKDTTLAMLWAARDLGWELYYTEQQNLGLDTQGQAVGQLYPLQVFRDENHWFELGEPAFQSLEELDVILMRKDPPFDINFVYTTYILEAAERAGVLVVNRPQSLRDCNEKVFATQFAQCCPPLIVSSQAHSLKEFHAEYKDIILKPLDGMGGSSIFRITGKDQNLSVVIETLTEHGTRPIMAQQYLPQIKDGDKRILMIDGEPIPYCLARIPASGESRGNLAAGGSGRPQPLSERDQWIANEVGPALRERGLIFVGLDVIGDYLTEINVTSPTCLREISRGYDIDIAAQLFAVIRQKLNAMGKQA